jgi:hypothetical protein
MKRLPFKWATLLITTLLVSACARIMPVPPVSGTPTPTKAVALLQAERQATFRLPWSAGITHCVVQDGSQSERRELGFDLRDEPVLAAHDGAVVYADFDLEGGGYMVKILHGDGSVSVYSHLSLIHVRVSEIVRRGQPIGVSGSTGAATGPFLGFAIQGGSTSAVFEEVGRELQKDDCVVSRNSS